MRLVAAVVMLAGCDGALGLGDIHVSPDAQYFDVAPDSPFALCSHFPTVDKVAFASPIDGISSLSVMLDDTEAAVFGKPNATAKPAVMSLQRTTATGPWGLATNGGPVSSISPQIASPADLFVGTLNLNLHYDLVETTYSTGGWHQVATLDNASDFDAVPTGYTQIGAMRIVVEVRRNTAADNTLLFRIDPQGTGAWMVEMQTAVTSAGNVHAAALTPDGLTMVYAASPSGMQTGIDLYVTYRAALGTEFPPGTQIDVSTPVSDETEPALVDNSCSHLYFRRDTTISVAH